MIRTLHIENYALIDALDMDWHGGFSVMTGETGAGKSIILGALSLLTGARAETRAVKEGARRCVVEATLELDGVAVEVFFAQHDLDYDGETCIVRREVTSAGKSRAFVNDTPVQLPVLRELVGRLVDIHSQHQNLLLGTASFQTQVLDALGDGAQLLPTYAEAYTAWRVAQQALQEAEADVARQGAEADYLRFQYDQLVAARLETGEEEVLAAEATLLEHAEDIRMALTTGAEALQGEGTDALSLLRQAEQVLSDIAALYPGAEALAERIATCRIELKDVAEDLAGRADGIECSSERLEVVNDRLALLGDLLKKHHVQTVDELITLQTQLGEQIERIDTSEERLTELRTKERTLLHRAMEQARALSAARQLAAQNAEGRMGELLRSLGMPNARFSAQVTLHIDKLGPTGGDDVAFLLAANKNAPLQDIGRVASGGETSRVMLCLKSLLHERTRTVIFDEIDTGVSGQIAEKMARLMAGIAQGGQVVSITHLPQIAAAGRHHYKVFKEDCADRTITCIKELSREERVEELAHMLSGEVLTAAAVENARELIKQYDDK